MRIFGITLCLIIWWLGVTVSTELTAPVMIVCSSAMAIIAFVNARLVYNDWMSK